MSNRIEKQDGGKVVPLHPKRKKSMNILYALLAVLVVGVSVYQIFRINYSPVDTEIALETTVDNAVTVEGFVVRDESYIRADAAGTLVPLVTDGHRVASGDAVAVVFGSEEAARNYTELQQVEEDIAYFESLQNKIGASTADVDVLEEQIYGAAQSYVLAMRSGNMDEYESYENAICEAITSRQLSTGTVIDPTEKLTALRARLSELQSASGGYTTVTADNPGYYISHVDGYENVISYDDVLTSTGPELAAVLSAEATPQSELQNCMGKLVDAFNWYLVCVLDTQTAASVVSGNTLTAEFPLTSAESVRATVVSVLPAENGQTVLVLQSNLMNQQYASLRKEQVRLVFDEITGFRVDNRAIREVDGVQGVYVVSGNLVEFKKVEIAYSDSEYSVCVTPTDDNGNPQSGYVELYDEIIIEGTDLYDGKILG